MKAELTWSLNICSFVALEGSALRSIKPLHPFPFTILCGIKTWWVGKWGGYVTLFHHGNVPLALISIYVQQRQHKAPLIIFRSSAEYHKSTALSIGLSDALFVRVEE